MKIALILIAVIAIVTLVIGGCAHRFKTPEKRAEYFTQKITKKLNLNDQQQIQLATLKEEILSIRKQMQGKRETTRNTLRELMSSTRLDQEQALTVVTGLAEDFQAKAPDVIAALGGFWDSLDAEQQSKVREKMAKHFERNGRWGHGHGHAM